MMILFLLICVFFISLHIFELNVDETEEGDLILWYTSLVKRERKYFVLIRHKDLLN